MPYNTCSCNSVDHNVQSHVSVYMLVGECGEHLVLHLVSFPELSRNENGSIEVYTISTFLPLRMLVSPHTKYLAHFPHYYSGKIVSPTIYFIGHFSLIKGKSNVPSH